MTREYAICTCDTCAKLGSRELYTKLSDAIKQLKMDPFIEVKTIRLKQTHAGEGIYVTLNGQRIGFPVSMRQINNS